jgi:hypothetical protein
MKPNALKGVILVSDAAPHTSVIGPEGLRPLLGRPFVLHVLEQMVLRGIRDVDVILDTPRPLDYEKALGNGERHGARLVYHLVRDPGNWAPKLRRYDEPVLLALAHRVLNAGVLGATAIPAQPIVWCAQTGTRYGWSGWAALPARALSALPDALGLEGLGDWLMSLGEEQGVLSAARPLLAADDAALLLRAQDLAFEADFLQTRGTALPGDVRIGREVIIDPEARIIGPVFLGDHVRIGAGAVIGPHAFIGAGAVVGRNTVLRHAIVTRRTYVGERLDIEHAIASGSGIAHAGRNAEVRVTDPFILSPLHRATLDVRGLTHRAVAGALFVAAAPMALGAWPLIAWNRRRARLAGATLATAERPSMADFLGRIVPALPRVVTGAIRLVGREEAPLGAADQMPEGWVARLSDMKVGLFSAATVDADPLPLVRRLSDLTFGASPSLRADFGLMRRYFAVAFRDFARGAWAAAFRKPAAWAMAAPARIRN